MQYSVVTKDETLKVIVCHSKVSKQYKAMDLSDDLFRYDSLAYAVCEITYETLNDILSGHEEFVWTQEELSGCCIKTSLVSSSILCFQFNKTLSKYSSVQALTS